MFVKLLHHTTLMFNSCRAACRLYGPRVDSLRPTVVSLQRSSLSPVTAQAGNTQTGPTRAGLALSDGEFPAIV